MKILHENTLNKQQLPQYQKLISNSHVSPSKLNIKLKTHSLTSLNIPLETWIGINDIPSSFANYRQRTMAGSVDFISEIPTQSTDENLSPVKPLLTMISSHDQKLSIPSENRLMIKHRFRMSTSILTPNSLNDSVARLRRTGYPQHTRQSSLQTIEKITERKHRSSSIRNGPIPKFTFRDLPAVFRFSSSTSNNPLKQSSQSQISSFTSLPEIRSFVAQNCSDHQQTINERFQLPLSSTSWKKTDSWSWKSINPIDKTNISNEKIIKSHQSNHPSRFELPVIIESPLQPRSSLQTNKQAEHFSSKKLINKHHSNQLSHHDSIQQNTTKFSSIKNSSFPHSISNYEVSSNHFSIPSTVHYPSTPHLSCSRQKYYDRFDSHPYQFHLSPLATFDDDSDTTSSNSSFLSCIDNIQEFSNIDTTEISSVLEGSFQDISASYDLHTELFDSTVKPSRSLTRHFCILQ